MAKRIQYTEPTGYFPKEIRDKYFKKGTEKKSTTAKTKKTVKKSTKK